MAKSVNPFGKAISKLTLGEIVKADWADISSLDEKLSRVFYNRLTKFAKPRVERIQKRGEYSKAYYYNIPQGIPKTYSTSTRNEIQHNIKIVKGFLEHRTSTITGIKAERKETSARIFGVDKRGRPKYEFKNKEEERRFWSAYSEFIHQNPSWALQSDKVQQFLAQETFWKTKDFSQSDFNTILASLNRMEFGDKWDNMEEFL